MILLIDNYDSFTFNLVQYLGELGADVRVVRNDQISISEIQKNQPEKIVISPGPCTPNEAGISVDVIKNFTGVLPILGVCLGHQSIGAAFGGKIVKASSVMHGKTSQVHHNGQDIFSGLPNPFTATRYHSLVIDPAYLPQELEITAWTSDKTIMGVKHKTAPVFGVQFHPESILTPYGKDILRNFLHV